MKIDGSRHSLVSLIRPYPRIFLPYAALTGPGDGHWVRGDTDIVIEGFERSGNTFAVLAFSTSQARPVEIAHHLHAAAQVIEAGRRRIPALVLLRPPEDAILSFLLFHPAVSASQAMRTYARFYGPLLPHKDEFVLARFDTVTQDFGSVIRCVNARFKTHFAEFEHTEENVRECFRLMEEDEQKKRGNPWVEETVSRPSVWRDETKRTMLSRFHDPSLSRLRSRVRQIHAECDAVADI